MNRQIPRPVRAGAVLVPDLYERYRLWGGLASSRRRIAAAQEHVRAALAVGPAYVSFSGGKDSLALLHLARQVSPDIPAIFFDCGAELPETYAVIDAVERMGIPLRRVYPELSTEQMLKIVGDLGYDGPERRPGEWHWTEAHWREVLLREPSRRMMAEGYAVSLWGLRKEESRGRRKNLQVRGPLYRRADGQWVGCPLMNWTGNDVIAYCLCNRLPLSSLYTDPTLTDSERAKRRTSNLFCEVGEAQGEMQRFRRAHPGLWADWIAIFPGLAKLG